jgi:4-amino-4-deoxy-L-arabinose transferase-like glycosyltransferase
LVLAVVILIAAFGLRVAYIEHTSYRAKNDAGTYNRLGAMVAQTGDYNVGSRPGTGAGGSRGPTAYFPPGFPYLLAGIDLIDGHRAGGKTAVQPERVAMAVLGTVSVGLIGLVALEAFGPGVALLSMALAAFYPVMIEMSGLLVAENLLVPLMLAAVWAALRTRRSRSPYAWIGAAGILTGLATLTHQNAIVMLVPLAFAAVASTAPRKISRWRRRPRGVGAVALLVATTALAIVPWTIRNAVELHHFVPVSDETGITLRGTYNPTSAAFRSVPYQWRFFWMIPADQDLRHTAGRYTELQLGSKLESRALNYIGAHPTAPLDVALHNTLRLFELEGSFAWRASALALALHTGVAQIGVYAFWTMCILALFGIPTRAAREAPRWIWWIPVLYALTIVFVNVETPRFRAPIDPFLVLLAGCAVEAGRQRLRVANARGRRRVRSASAARA